MSDKLSIEATWSDLKCAFYRAVDSRPAELLEYLLGLQKRIEILERSMKHTLPPGHPATQANICQECGAPLPAHYRNCPTLVDPD